MSDQRTSDHPLDCQCTLCWERSSGTTLPTTPVPSVSLTSNPLPKINETAAMALAGLLNSGEALRRILRLTADETSVADDELGRLRWLNKLLHANRAACVDDVLAVFDRYWPTKCSDA